jgi:hypothetical protein
MVHHPIKTSAMHHDIWGGSRRDSFHFRWHGCLQTGYLQLRPDGRPVYGPPFSLLQHRQQTQQHLGLAYLIVAPATTQKTLRTELYGYYKVG